MVFRFKAFDVVQAKSAMKVGTDAVLLGAWAPFSSSAESILDIGTGTGVLALMMAQRFPQAYITALDIDKAAAEESRYNFEQSPWNNRLSALHSSLALFCRDAQKTFDGIICNPPFYKDGFSPNQTPRSIARDSEHLHYEDLFAAVKKCLSPQGEFALVAPFADKAHLLDLGKAQNLFPKEILSVRARPHLSFKRSCILFAQSPSSPVLEQSLTLEWEQHHRTPEYQKLVDSFYL